MGPQRDPSTSLILSGGGSYSAYEVGVMKALFSGHAPSTDHEPFDPDVLIGTSAGAMNAAMLAAREARAGGLLGATEQLEATWLERIAEGAKRCGNGVYRIRGLLPLSLFDRHCRERGPAPLLAEAVEDAVVFLRQAMGSAVQVVRSIEPPLRSLVRSIDFTALISTEPFEESLRTALSLDDLARSPRRLRIVALDLTLGSVRLFTEEDVPRLGYLPLRASAAIPVFFPPHEIEGRVYVNGTTLATTPLLPAISETDIIHVVYMDPDLRTIPRRRLENVVDAIDRILVINFAYMFNKDIEIARLINSGLNLIDAGPPPGGYSDEEIHTLLRTMPRIDRRIREGNPYRRLTIHRYHPKEDLGEELGLMNLDRDRLAHIIAKGYRDTVEHDCEESGCLLPHETVGERSPAGPPRRGFTRSAAGAPRSGFGASPGVPPLITNAEQIHDI